MISECETRIEELHTEKENTGVECQELQSQFKKLVHDNKFADFLRKIFKKKYRPPRDRDDEEGLCQRQNSPFTLNRKGNVKYISFILIFQNSFVLETVWEFNEFLIGKKILLTPSLQFLIKSIRRDSIGYTSYLERSTSAALPVRLCCYLPLFIEKLS